MAWHHVVEQSKEAQFGRARINSLDNVIRIPAKVNQDLNAYYSSKQDFTEGLTVRNWLKGQSWQKQMSFGMNALRKALAGTLAK